MFETVPEVGETKLKKVKISDHFNGPVTPNEIHRFLLEHDTLKPAPGETAAELRKAYTEQPEDETVLVASDQLNMVNSKEKWQVGLYHRAGDTSVQGVAAIPMSVKLNPSIEYMIVAIR